MSPSERRLTSAQISSYEAPFLRRQVRSTTETSTRSSRLFSFRSLLRPKGPGGDAAAVALICKSETAMILLLFGFGLAFGQPLAPTAAPTDAEWTVPKECVASFKYYDVSYNGCTKTGTDGEGEFINLLP